MSYPTHPLARVSFEKRNQAHAEKQLRELTRFYDMPELQEAAAVVGRRVRDVLRWRAKPPPPIFQWALVTAATVPKLSALTRCWLLFRPGGAPELIYRVIAARMGERVAKSIRNVPPAMEIISNLYNVTYTPETNTYVLAELKQARIIAATVLANAKTLRDQIGARALEESAAPDARTAAVNVCSWAIDTFIPLGGTCEADIVHVIGLDIKEVCTQALNKHPQKELLMSAIG